MGNPNLKAKGFDFLIFCKKKLRQNMWNRGSSCLALSVVVVVVVDVIKKKVN